MCVFVRCGREQKMWDLVYEKLSFGIILRSVPTVNRDPRAGNVPLWRGLGRFCLPADSFCPLRSSLAAPQWAKEEGCEDLKLGKETFSLPPLNLPLPLLKAC